MITTLALNESRNPGDVVEILGRNYRIVASMSREEYESDLRRRRQQDRAAGLPPARAGMYIAETKEFVPGRETPAENKYCYRVTPEGFEG